MKFSFCQCVKSALRSTLFVTEYRAVDVASVLYQLIMLHYYRFESARSSVAKMGACCRHHHFKIRHEVCTINFQRPLAKSDGYNNTIK